MACPYFYPIQRLESATWVIPPRAPLGDPYVGECRATIPFSQPDEDRLRKFCNFGYGRGSCDCFPPDSDSDATRFHVVKDTGKIIGIQFIHEKYCWPIRQGSLEYSRDSASITSQGCEEIIERQASAFVESYLRRGA